MEFTEFKEKMQTHFSQMIKDQNVLFAVNVPGDFIWETYLDSFPPGTNELYRERREFDCSCCKSFIRRFGNVVTIKDNQVITIWDFRVGDEKFDAVLGALSVVVSAYAVNEVFITKESAFGTDISRELLESGNVHTWQHFRINLPRRFISNSNKSEADLRGKARDSKNVFKRSLGEISRYAIETVLDLIAEKTLYRGEEWQPALQKFLELHNEYHNLPENEQDNFCWLKSTELGGSITRIRNHSIGVLLQDITNGTDLLEAVRKYEHIIAPSNYKRPKAIFTKRMVEDAQSTVTELGLSNSLGRRYATLSDITINNVLWANRDAEKHMNGVDGVFEMLKQETTVDAKGFNNLPGVSIERFMTDVLPTAKSIEALLENKHQSNFMSLIAPQESDSKSLFKWDNSFSWAYNGNIADSMKQRVKAAGGKVDGVLRFSIQWNENNDNPNDFDAHCREPRGNLIYYSNMRNSRTTGVLDVDIINPGNKTAVENITWSNLRKMETGHYTFLVHNYSHNGGRSGFSAEIEFGGQVFEYEYRKDIPNNSKIKVANVTFNGHDFIIEHKLPSSTSSRKVWNLNTNQFQLVSTVMFSPNYWDGNTTGNKHHFFMLAGCQNDEQPNGFFNEYLKEEFTPHRKVFEALGSKMKVEKSDNQLSGLGFSSTQRNSLIVKVDNRVIKIIF